MFTNNEVQNTVARKIENHLAAKAIKRKELIEALGMSYHSFERRMKGEVPFSIIEVWTIAEVLRTAPYSLLPDDKAAHSAVAA